MNLSTATAYSATLSLSNAQAADVAFYSCVISTISRNSITSAAAALSLSHVCRCCLADVAGYGPNNGAPDSIIGVTDFIEFINAFTPGC